MRIAGAWNTYGGIGDLQTPYDVAVVMPTIGRKEGAEAIRSIFRQINVPRIQVLIGVDQLDGELSHLIDALDECPEHITAHLFYPGYSTSMRHGGVHLAHDGGALRTILSLLANSKYVAYLDDDNWWEETHLYRLLHAIQGHAWAFSLRHFVHPDTRKTICIDDWESVGPGKGIFVEKFGGWVDPNCLMIDKLTCWSILPLWTIPMNGDVTRLTADRNVYHLLQTHSAPGQSNSATTFYVLRCSDILHPLRLQAMGENFERAAS